MNNKLLTSGGGHDVLLNPITVKNGPMMTGSSHISQNFKVTSIPVALLYLPIDNAFK